MKQVLITMGSLLVALPLQAKQTQTDWLDEVDIQSNLFAQVGYYQTDRETAYSIPGVVTDAKAFHYEEGLQLMHGELGFLASLDNVLAAKLIIGSHHGESIELEELWLQPHLHQDWTVRIGRQLSPIGLYNGVHEHDWRFLDASLTQQAFLGSQYSDDSVQLTFAQNRYDTTIWLGRGSEYPAQYDSSSASPAAFGLTANWYQLRADYQLQVMASAAYFNATSRKQAENDGHSHAHTASSNLTYDGDTTLLTFGADLKWNNFNWQVEWMGQRLNATLTDSQQIRTELDAFQHGVSTQLSWQYQNLEMGARYDWLITDNEVTKTNAEFEQVLDAKGHAPQRISAIANWHFAMHQLLRFQTNYEFILQTKQTAFWLVYQGNLTW